MEVATEKTLRKANGAEHCLKCSFCGANEALYEFMLPSGRVLICRHDASVIVKEFLEYIKGDD